MLRSGRFVVAVLLGAVCVIGTACDQRKGGDVASLLPDVEPFEQLEKVQLNMTAEELYTLRPSIRNAPYLGFQDSIGGFLVGFQFPRNQTEKMETPPNDRLSWVSAERRFSSEADADTAFRNAVERVAAHLGAPTKCFSVVPGNDTRHFAHWPVDSAHVYVQYSTAQGLPGSEAARAQPAGVWTVVSREGPLYPKRLTPTPETCPTKSS